MANTEWLGEESKALATGHLDIEKLPSLKMEVGKITTFSVDFSNPFAKWEGDDKKGGKVKKAIIPVMYQGKPHNFWLNVKNPLYRQIVDAGLKGITTFRVIQTGTQAETKYTLVEG